jgi:hypothetical protein
VLSFSLPLRWHNEGMVDDPIYDSSAYEPPVDLRPADEKMFFDYAYRGMCPLCSSAEGKDVAIPEGHEECRHCGFMISLQDWQRTLEKAYRAMLAKCESKKICHPTQTAAEAHAEGLARHSGYRASVYFHRACSSYHVGDSSNIHKRKLKAKARGAS